MRFTCQAVAVTGVLAYDVGGRCAHFQRGTAKTGSFGTFQLLGQRRDRGRPVNENWTSKMRVNSTQVVGTARGGRPATACVASPEGSRLRSVRVLAAHHLSLQ